MIRQASAYRLRPILPVAIVGAYLAINSIHITRLPPIHNDEISILAPGYKLFQQGVFGLDMYTGYFDQDRIYLEVMPLMSILQGAVASLLGVGVWQMRILPVFCGSVIMILTYAISQELTFRSRTSTHPVGVTAMVLVLFWQWAPGGDDFLATGIPLLDVSRIGRYDILVPVLGMGAMFAWMTGRRTRLLRHEIACGVLLGLAALSHLYGLAWATALMLLTWLDYRPGDEGGEIHRTTIILLGIPALFLLSWGAITVLNWDQFLGQMSKHQGRFDFLSFSFYIQNILHEPQRYALGIRSSAVWTRAGFWLLVAGVPLAVIWLARRTFKEGQRPGLWLLLPLILIPLQFALLISEKRFYYLMSVAPLFSIATAWAGQHIYLRSKVWLRVVLLVFILILAFQGSQAILNMHQRAARTPSANGYLAALDRVLPANGKILGPQILWVGLASREYRSFGLVFVQSSPQNPHRRSFSQILEEISPDLIILSPEIERWMQMSDVLIPETKPRGEQLNAYLEAHQAVVLGSLQDNRDQTIIILATQN